MVQITDEFMREWLNKSKAYCVVILADGPKRNDPDAKKFVWEHGRRNFQLRAQGKLSVVCPVRDDSNIAGIGIFTTDPQETRKIMDGDPAVEAGILTYAIHPCVGFPGDALR